MKIFKNLGQVSLVIACFSILVGPSLAQDASKMQEQAIATRQGYMKLVLWEAGPLFGMAKGERRIFTGAPIRSAHSSRLR